MKSEQISVYNIATGYQFKETGTKAAIIADKVIRIGLQVAGVANKYIGLGGSLLSIFEIAADTNVITTSAKDFTQIQLIYDDTKQWTYGKFDGISWYLGYCSESVKVKEVEIYQQFVVDGVGTQERTYMYPNTTVKSTNFDSPWGRAYIGLLNPIIEWVSYEINGVTWYFS